VEAENDLLVCDNAPDRCRCYPTLTLEWPMEFEISKVDAAVEQLDWAIRLFLDHKAYIPSIALAGAAEEVLGQAVADRAAFTVLKSRLATEFSLPEKVVSQDYLNKAKNWLKHWDGRTDKEKIRLELDSEAIQYIVRALTNLASHDNSWPSEGPRFYTWIEKHRRDLFE